MGLVEDTAKAMRFQRPERIPVHFGFNASCWFHYDQQALQDLMEAHPYLFPNFRRRERIEPQLSPEQQAHRSARDCWGCVWKTAQDGIVGQVVEHPLADWSAFDSYEPPDPDTCDGRWSCDWDEKRRQFQAAKQRDGYAGASLLHGHTFLHLCDLRGYENLMLDMADGEPRLDALVTMVERFNTALVERMLSWGPDHFGFPEDLGMQRGPMLMPEHFRRYIKPVYRRMMSKVSDAGVMVSMHCDGDIRTLADDLLDVGVGCLNVQGLVNGVEWIRDNLKGRVCIDLDVDRQNTVRFGSPADIDALIHYEAEQLGSPEGGLMFRVDMYPGIPLENVGALMDALEKYSTIWS
ncbi:MAG: uroporphyrinogen decarboxylase family protein [Planctomycetota bacterium]